MVKQIPRVGFGVSGCPDNATSRQIAGDMQAWGLMEKNCSTAEIPTG